MKKTIEILEHELSYAKGNRAECNQNDDFYEGWVESLKCAIGVLCSSENASQQAVEADANNCPLRCDCLESTVECHNLGCLDRSTA